MKTVRTATATLLATTLLTGLSACSSDGDRRVAPRGWIARHYQPSDSGYLDRTDGPRKVADEITGERKAIARRTSRGWVLLRYDDDIVAISPKGSGSRIDVDDYRDGHRRWNTYIGNVWPAPGSGGGDFRGGGPGSGK
ncbi:DUF4247 domain-containing protein [Streptomyces sp. TRM70308]|uniref:DUF4247 domain-containing protein n=1 Tax=Streptomyces sp. TRM70308 TaxID=3131932 RepID=UPI003CFD3BC7